MSANRQSFQSISRGRDNNLVLVRFLAATMVVVSHSLAMYDENRFDVMLRNFRAGYGDLGVNIFFLISGYLITKSWFGKKNLIDFCWARFLRIFPALWVSTAAFVLVCGLFFAAEPFWTFVSRDSTLSYVASNLTMLPGIGAQMDLPSAIGNWTDHFNVPLWTLPHELQMYGLVVILGVAGLLAYRFIAIAILVLSFTAWVLADFDVAPLTGSRYRLMFHFFAGVVTYHFASRIYLSGRMTLAAIMLCITASITLGATLAEYVLAWMTPIILLWAGYYPGGPLRQFNRLGDYSYGIYIFGYPIQVIYTYYFGEQISVLGHFVLSMSTLLVISAASWHLIESKALRATLPQPIAGLRQWIGERLVFLNEGILSPNRL